MTTPPPVNQDSRSGEAVQPGVKSALLFLFAAVVFVTSVVVPGSPFRSQGCNTSPGISFVLIPAIQILATGGMVFSEWKMAARQSAGGKVARRMLWLYVAMTAAIGFITFKEWRSLAEGWEATDAYISLTWWWRECYTGLPWAPASVVALVGTASCALIRARALPKAPPKTVDQLPPAAIGVTHDGQAIYPVVGYTADGTPVTADRTAGVRPIATGTNNMAIAALITGLTIAPLGIVFGHIALSQIKQTGQGGRGLAIAGLVLGYVTVALYAVAFLVIGARL
ncbi:DUF4190 domain-containing protein [Mycolicibacterium sp. CBMA 226]|uniref:DUF4190 domain-containing protein n=1 Tax=Mycolicibacterium sp. CBMA 226 TaxID=2606611 RepID=UPI0013198F55|nr:hypothetical protein ICEMyc226_00050 [Mycolicibacterium sp.]